MARILFVEYSREIGGSVVCLYNLVKALDRKRFEPVILIGGENHFTHELKRGGVRVLTFSPSREFWRNVAQIRHAIRKVRPDIVHSFDELPSNTEAVLAAKSCGVNCVCHLMGENPLRKKHVLFAWLCDRMIAVSEAVKRHYMKYRVPAHKLIVIHHGTNVFGFNPGESGQAFRERHGLHKDELVVSSVGRLADLKGFDYFLHAAALAAKKVPKARFVIAGTGPEGAKLKKLAARLGLAGKTVFTGQVRKISQLYAASDGVVLASTWREAFSNVLLEAFAMGKPVIATAVGGNQEIVHSGEVGLIVPPKNAEKMAEAMVELLTDAKLRERLGRNARKRAEQHLDIGTTARKIEALYRELLGN